MKYKVIKIGLTFGNVQVMERELNAKVHTEAPLKRWGPFYKQTLIIEPNDDTILTKKDVRRVMTSRTLLVDNTSIDRYLSALIMNRVS